MNAAANAGFYFMPIILGWSACSKLKADPALGALLGMTLVYSDINNVAGLDFLGLPVTQVQYNGSFLPMILGAAFLSFVYRFFKNKIPQACRYFLLPLVTLVISIPVTLVVLGPIGYIAGTKLMWFLNLPAGQFKIGALAVWGFCTPLSIITGMDKAVYFINMEHLNMVGYDNIFPPGGLAGNAAIGSVFAGLVDLKQYVYAGPGLITSPVYISPDGSMTNFYFCLITIAVSALAGFAMTYLFSMRNRSQYDGDAAEEKVEKTEGADTALTGKEKDESVASAAIEQDIVAVVDGKSIPIEEVKDGVFSEKMMGEGIAFLPEDGKVVAPCSGKMSVVYDTGHAYGITGGPAGYDVGLP